MVFPLLGFCMRCWMLWISPRTLLAGGVMWVTDAVRSRVKVDSQFRGVVIGCDGPLGRLSSPLAARGMLIAYTGEAPNWGDDIGP